MTSAVLKLTIIFVLTAIRTLAIIVNHEMEAIPENLKLTDIKFDHQKVGTLQFCEC